MFGVFEEMAPTVEGVSIDEAFLDVRGLDHIIGTPIEIAVRLRWEIRERVGLPITVGVARTKFLAKVASGVAKPDGLLLVPPEFELAFLHPLPVERLWGVGKVTSRKLRGQEITTVGEVAALSETTLVSLLGEPRAGICTRSRTTMIRGPWCAAGAGGRSAPSGRWGGAGERARSWRRR